ncbi:DUF6867 family protein [Methylopila sp. M107]|uniref:DUF6867 family protein n=1 Tax=Methylopila sp. M107 TaxID=1101190 RepID=UPI000381B591|nr:hypothetical protein [Methylopila sp. M107]
METLRSFYETLNALGLGWLWEISLAEFGFATLVLGGGAAWLAGRGVASAWEPAWKAALWMLPLGFAVRFIHYAIFSGTLQLNPTGAAAAGFAATLHYYLVDLVFLVVFAVLGHRRTLTRMMTRQYAWLYEPAGPFAWKARGG